MCIVQNDPIDWAEQSADMASIYQGAYMTICATGSQDDNGGCYSGVPPSSQPQPLQVRKRNGMEYEVYVSAVGLEKRHVPHWNQSADDDVAVNFPLLQRGWTYQERLLSKRLIHFAKGELMWECAEFSDCECSAEPPGQNSLFKNRVDKKNHQEALYEDENRLKRYWNEIVMVYSGLHLSFGKDRLPALSGVAKQMLHSRKGDQYLAGMWKKSIVYDLCWRSWKGESRRPVSYRAPSWTWASLDGAFNFDTSIKSKSGEFEDFHAKCVQVVINPLGPDPTGEVASGYIILEAACRKGILTKNQGLFYNSPQWCLDANGAQVDCWLDCESDLSSGAVKLGDSLLCLWLGAVSYGRDFGLMLKQRGEENGERVYQRVGHVRESQARLTTDLKSWSFSNLPRSDVKIL
jgi:hypothetical protein